MPLPMSGFARNALLSVAVTAKRRPGAVLVAMAAGLALVAGPAAGTTYKWTDANGRVIYSDQPPTGNFKVEALSAPPPPANPNAAKELAAKEAEVQQRRMLRTEEEAKAAKKGADTAQKREQCTKVRGQVALMQSDPNLLYRADEKGQPVYLDDAGRRREIEKLNAWTRENCAN